MSSSDFRQIAVRSESGKVEKLFRAAISAFCSLTRPSRREAAQLEDLTLPLFDSVSVEAKRFAAAALSESPSAPVTLVARLCDESVDIAAPLLIRSSVLTNVDLIALIGRYGLPHARAIARRDNLHPTIADLIRALEKPKLVSSANTLVAANAPAAPSQLSVDVEARDSIEKGSVQRQKAGEAAENARRRLRALMLASAPTAVEDDTQPAGREATPTVYRKLRESALTGNTGLLAGALSTLLRVDMRRAQAIVEASTYSELLIAMRSLHLNEEQAFVVAAAAFPRLFSHAEAVRLFLERHRLCDIDSAKDRVRAWRAAGLSEMPRPVAANEAMRVPSVRAS